MEYELNILLCKIKELNTIEKIDAINKVKEALHEISPFKNEPVDCVLWIPNNKVVANDYNPNRVAPPEMKLLGVSIMNDGYTQPIVTYPENSHFTVVDGFHRTRIGKENKEVEDRVLSYLPITKIRQTQEDRGDRIASTIRHNRARGKHIIDGMCEIVLELKKRNWSNKKIGSELGMDPDEILRLAQITGLKDIFKDEDFSKSWEADSVNDINDLDTLELNEENIKVKKNKNNLFDVNKQEVK